jgi:hypothetical protein
VPSHEKKKEDVIHYPRFLVAAAQPINESEVSTQPLLVEAALWKVTT